jgi:hypothetical protein
MKTQINTFFVEGSNQALRAEVYQDDNGYGIQYFKDGTIFNEVRLPGATLQATEKMAEDWVAGVQNL